MVLLGVARPRAASSACVTGVSVKAQYCYLEVNQVPALEEAICVSCYHKCPVHFKDCGYRQYRYIVIKLTKLTRCQYFMI